MTNRPKRVLMLVENNPFWRDVRVRQEAQALQEAGYVVSVICPGMNGRKFHEEMDGIHIFAYPPPFQGRGFIGYAYEYGYSLLAMFLVSLHVFARRGFDIIHAANPPDTAVLIAIFYKLFRRQFVYDHHDLSPEVFSLRFGAEKWFARLVYEILVFLERLSCRVADHVITTNQSYMNIELHRSKIPESSITIVRNGPDLERLRRVEFPPELRREGKTTIGYLGIIGYQDGVNHLLNILHVLAYELNRRDFFCVIAGGGDALEDLKKQATILNLDEFVMFTGYVPHEEVAKYISAADLCVAPEKPNPFNHYSTIIKVMEYMALGKPVVAFDLIEHRYSAHDAALYAVNGEELDFARKIALLMDNTEQREEMGKLGKARVEDVLAWRHQAKALVAAYEKIRAGK
ncbi:MAG: glycosyltransferase family 4 protein [Anaerolineales bacterium]|nr:glycosyltransferase family 4 protein [Anaerolineales bacterium]